MDYYKEKLIEMANDLREQRDFYAIELKRAPSGVLYKQKSNERTRFYRAYRENGRLIRKGISRNEDQIKGLARKEFLHRSIASLNNDLALLENVIERFECSDAEKIIASMRSAYRDLPSSYFFLQDQDEAPINFTPPTPGVFTPAEKILGKDATGAKLRGDENEVDARMKHHQHWSLQPFNASVFRPEEKNKLTSWGLQMRSKSEVIIAERLRYYGIPFRYEQTLHLGINTFSVDFTFQDYNCRDFFLEYCGMMNNEKYVSHHIWKKAQYEKNGIVPWENIIYLYETDGNIDIKKIDNCIVHEIIPRL